jgi:hypothetical protein
VNTVHDAQNVRDTKLFDMAQYRGSYTGGYHESKWEDDKWLPVVSISPTFYEQLLRQNPFAKKLQTQILST